MTGPSDDELLDQARRELTEAGLWDVDGDVAALAERFLGHAPRPVRVAEFTAAVAERRARIPLGHLTGTTTFDGLRLVVGSGAFIPRTESVALVEWAAQPDVLPTAGTVLDLCSGVGAIGLALARRRPDATVCCVERDDTALQYLRRNATRLADVTGAVGVLTVDLTEPGCLDAYEAATDLIVANPPYVPPSLRLLPEWADHHPRDAIYSGPDGLDLIRRIAALSATTLRPGGWLGVEHDRAQPGAVRQILTEHGFTDIVTLTDSAGETRLSVARTATKEPR
ncbi:N5-glutamine methyltransferase family protein [Micromonospora sp. NPDC051925]|uniref:N5-glutamine methyltransferase family protein n=1 Tax=Micromonospora sp. NPDC051925 TaxID=3364288 RepID=UPI0037C6A9BB